MAEAINGGNAPDLILFGTTYDGRDVAARLSVKLDKPVLSNNTEIAVDGDAVVASTPVFGGTQIVRTKLTAGTPNIVLVRPKSFAAEESGGGAAAVEALAVPDPGATARPRSSTVTSRRPPGRSSTKRRSSCPAVGVWARPASTRWWSPSPSC